MAQDNTVEIRISVVGADEAQRSMRSVEKSLSTMNIALGSFLGNLASSAFRNGISMFEDLAKSAMGFVKSSLESADALQQNRIAMEVMLGSGEKAKKLLEDLSKFALVTPFNLTDLQEYSKQLLSAGVQQERIIPIMKTLGDISAGIGRDKLPYLIHSFQQMESSGKLTGIQMREFMHSGVPAVRMLTDYYNKFGISTLNASNGTKNLNAMMQKLGINFTKGSLTAEQLQKLIEKDLVISVKDVEEAFGMATDKGGMFNDMMGRQMHTLGGMMSNLEDYKDKFMRTLGGMTEGGDLVKGGLLDETQKGLEKLMEFIDAHGPEIAQIGSDIGKGLGVFVGEILPRIIQHLPEFLATIKEIFRNMKENFPTTLQRFRDLLEIINQLRIRGEFWLDSFKLGLLIVQSDVLNLNMFLLGMQIRLQEILGGSADPRLLTQMDIFHQQLVDTQKEIEGTAKHMSDLTLQSTAAVDAAKKKIGELAPTLAYAGVASDSLGRTMESLGRNGASYINNIVNAAYRAAGAIGYASGAAGGFAKQLSMVNNIGFGGIRSGSVKGFAEGGVVPGNSLSGDRILARVNSGEMILTRDQQSTLFSILKNMAGQNGKTFNVNANFSGGSRSEQQEMSLFSQLFKSI